MTTSPSRAGTDAELLLASIGEIASEWGRERRDRQRRRDLDPVDFDRLQSAGYRRASLPIDEGGLWESQAQSSRLIFELLRRLAHADSSVALVCAMHPLVLSTAGWLGSSVASPPYQEAWTAQQKWVFQTVRNGAWWGTIMSESGSSGDISQSRAIARPDAAAGDPLS